MSEAALRQLSADAATLFERLARAERAEAAEGHEADVESLLALWARRFAGGDEQALLRRLSWDGLKPGQLASALAQPPGSTPATWTGWLPEVVAAAREAADQPRRGSPEPGEPPFAEVWAPFVRVARESLARHSARHLRLVHARALRACEARLAQELAVVGELALYERFEGRRSQSYGRFVSDLLAGELQAVFEELPVLARQWTRLLHTWVEAIGELLERLDHDRDGLAAFLAVDELGQLVDAGVGLSDRHHGGRRVVALEFASGERVIYKPRDVGLEVAVGAFFAWCAEAGLHEAPRAPRSLPREGYAWVEALLPARLDGAAAAERYFRTAGRLLCLVHVLGGRDLHGENVVATSDGPVVVDAEALLTPGRPDEAGPDADGTAGPHAPGGEAGSFLASDLLTHVQQDPDAGPCDVGGLQPGLPRRREVPVRSWHSLRSDQLGYSLEHTVVTELANQPLLAGEALRVEDHGEAVGQGFEEAYRFLVERRAQLLAPDGPLAGLQEHSARMLFRPSGQYAALLYVTGVPRYQRSGVEASLALETLNRVFAGEREPPLLWPLVREEREDLEGLDIPRFAVEVTATAARARDGRRVEMAFSESGIDAVRRRLRLLGEADLARQLEQLECALAPPRPGPGPKAGLIGAASLIGQELLYLGRSSGEALTWSACEGEGLYEGSAGPALFLAALFGATGDEAWREAALAALSSLGGTAGGPGVGVADGAGSVAYALALSGDLLGHDGLRERALAAAGRIDADAIAGAPELDVAGGVAGALLALLALHRQSGGAWLLDRALTCAERLVREQGQEGPDAGGWSGSDGRLRAGFAHGAAGVAYALVRLHESQPDPGWLEAAARGLRFERRLYSAVDRNWLVVGRSGGRVPMLGWCHGAPGIALARALVRGRLSDPALDAELRTALETTLGSGPSVHDHLCCGSMGICDALLTAGRMLSEPRLVQAGEERARSLSTRLLQHGRLALRTAGSERRQVHPGFFQGVSGVGYQLLRVARPQQIPSVLAFMTRGGSR